MVAVNDRGWVWIAGRFYNTEDAELVQRAISKAVAWLEAVEGK